MASLVEAGIPPAVLEKPAARVLHQALGDRLLGASDFRGDLALTVTREAWVQAAAPLRDHPQLRFKLFLDLCGVDYLDTRDQRYEVVLHLYSVDTRHHVRLQMPLPEADPALATLTGVFRGAAWFEREAWDLYGIRFEGHPNLTRLLTHESFVGHPMRKDYPTARRHVLKTPREFLLNVPARSEHTCYGHCRSNQYRVNKTPSKSYCLYP